MSKQSFCWLVGLTISAMLFLFIGAAQADMVFVSNAGDNEVYKFDSSLPTASNLVGTFTSVNLTAATTAPAIGPDGNLYVPCWDNKVVIVNPTTLAELGVIDVSGGSSGGGMDVSFDTSGRMLMTKFDGNGSKVDRYTYSGGSWSLTTTGLISMASSYPTNAGSEGTYVDNGKIYVGLRTNLGFGVHDEETGAMAAGSPFRGGTAVQGFSKATVGPDGNVYVTGKEALAPHPLWKFDGSDNSYLGTAFGGQSFEQAVDMAFLSDGTPLVVDGGRPVDGATPGIDGELWMYSGGSWSQFTTAISVGPDKLHSIAILTPIPEPSTLMLLAAGLVGLLAYAWRKRR